MESHNRLRPERTHQREEISDKPELTKPAYFPVLFYARPSPEHYFIFKTRFLLEIFFSLEKNSFLETLFYVDILIELIIFLFKF